MSARRDLPSLDQCLSKLREKKVSGVSVIPVINVFCFVDWPVSVRERKAEGKLCYYRSQACMWNARSEH